MFHPLQTLFSRPQVTWEASDLKYFVQSYLQAKLQTSQITCEEITGERAMVVVPTPAYQQAVQLLEYDVVRDFTQTTQHVLKQVVVRVG